MPNLKLHVDDARSWFASTTEKFDLVQMSMIDTWAATEPGSFSLSENGLYTLEGWRAFMNTLNDDGFFTVSRWYNPDDVKETGRMIGLATAAAARYGRERCAAAPVRGAGGSYRYAGPGEIAVYRPNNCAVRNNEVQRIGV